MARISIPLGAAARLNGQWTIALGEGARLIARSSAHRAAPPSNSSPGRREPRRWSKGCFAATPPVPPPPGEGWVGG